jgi:hypothetical protein
MDLKNTVAFLVEREKTGWIATNGRSAGWSGGMPKRKVSGFFRALHVAGERVETVGALFRYESCSYSLSICKGLWPVRSIFRVTHSSENSSGGRPTDEMIS